MSADNISMREASRVMGVSQLRVRELIRKGTLQAEKVPDGAGERWTILSASVQDYMKRRPPRPDGAGVAGTSGRPDDLVRGLEAQLGRVKALFEEVRRAQASLDALQRGLVTELRRASAPPPSPPAEPADAKEAARKAVEAAREAVEAAKTADKPSEDARAPAPAPAAKPPAKARAGPKGARAAPKGAKPARATKSAPAKDGKASKAAGETAMGAALRTAGVAPKKTARKAPAKKK